MIRFFKRRGAGGLEPEIFKRDQRLVRIVDHLAEQCEYFLALGKEAGISAIYAGNRYPRLECLAGEHSGEAYFVLADKAAELKNVYLHNQKPSEFLSTLESDKPYLFSRDVLFVLSPSGGGADRRFGEEVAFIMEKFRGLFLLITGFKVPGREEFRFETHRGRECSAKNLAGCFTGENRVYYPAYAPASMRKPSAGWVLVAAGRNADYEFTDDVAELLSRDGGQGESS